MFLKKKFASNIDFLIVGLGNPGREYENTRHNAGFMVVDEIARKLDVKIDRLKFKSLYTIADYKDKKIMLLKPQTFMNLSGEAVVEALQFYKLDIKNTVVICDDINFDVGKLRIRAKGSDGGQNGLKSIIANLGSDKFTRIRIGIGQKPHPAYELAAWVLSRFTESDRKAIDSSLDRVCDTVELLIAGKDDEAMRLCNSN